MAWSIEWILLFGEISIYQFRYWHTTLLVSHRRRDNPSSICQLKRILQHKATLMEEELLHNKAVIPNARPPAPQQHAPLPQRAGDSLNLPPPPSPAVKRRARPRLALHGRCCPPGPLGAVRAAAWPYLGVKLPSLESVTSKELQPASAIAVCCSASARAGPRWINQNVHIEAQNVDIHICFWTSISKNRRYRTTRYRSRNVDFEVSSISGCVDIEVQNVDIDEFSISGYVDIEVY